MQLDENMCRVLADLEYLIGSECYNPNSYDGWNDIEGCNFRYPINVPVNDDDYIKLKTRISYIITEISPDMITYMKYKFGSNELFVGLGLINILDYLEERYNLDFNKLENNLQKIRKE